MSYSSEVLTDSPLLLANLDEATGATSLADSSGNSHPFGTVVAGTATFGAAAAAALPGTSITFPGNAYAKCVSPTFLNSLTTITVEMWFKSTTSGTLYMLTRDDVSGGTATHRSFHFYLASGQLTFLLFNTAGGFSFAISGTTYLDGAWHHGVGTFDGTNIKVYVDKVLKGTTAMSGTWRASAGSDLMLGGVWNNATSTPASQYVGSADAVAVYGTALSSTRIGVHYDAGVTAAGVTGTIPATLPSMTASIAGTYTPATVTGTVAATLPSLTASLAGTYTPATVTGDIAATLPSLTASLEGTHTSNDQVGTISATLPALTASIEGDYTPEPVTGSVAATLPSLTASITELTGVIGEVHATLPALTAAITDDTGDRTGTIAATLPALSAVIVGSVPVTSGEPWTADLSQRTLLAITTAVTSPTFVPPLAAIPASIVEHPITRASVVVPDPATLDPADVRTDPRTGRIVIRDAVYDAFPVTTAIVGVPHIIIGGRDVTYFRDSRTIVRNDQAAEPFGDQALVVEFPQIDSMDDPEDPELSWLDTDKPVHYVMQLWDADGPTGEVETLFSGFLVSDDTGNDETTLQTVWTARGDLYAAAMFAHLPRLLLNPVDIGTQVPKVFNGVTNRPYGTIPNKTTGIPTTQRGEPNSKVMSYAQALLGDAWTTGGNQWTVAKKAGTRNSYEVRQKKTGVDWIVTNGQRGVSIALSADRTQHPNVIIGRGQRTDGGVWMNKKFPESGKTAPDYPYTFPGTVMSIGSTDAGTTDGDGVSKWQRRANTLGFSVTVDGVFSSADATVCRALQARYAILVDGIVGPQTWAETFDVGALGADPDSWVRLPLAWVPGTQERRYSATGVDLGEDPAWNKTMRVVKEEIDFGTDVSLADGIRSAQQIIDRGNPLPLTGTITLTTDPRQDSRFRIQAGDRIQVIGYKGRNVTLHIADRGRDWTGKGPITLQVAEKPTDALTLAQIRQRNNANRADPARRPGKIHTKPTIDPWDCESNAGQIERRAQYGGLWSVTRMPMSEVGRIARLNLTCSSATEFAFFLFAKQITSAQMIRYVGTNPSAIADPGSTNRELLEDRFGWIEGFGGSNGMLGHFPNGPDGAVTGRAQESGIDYYSPDQYLYLAIWTASSTFIEGDMRAAPPEA